jgi:diaminopimelate epimerase
MFFSKWHGLGNDFLIVEPDKNPGYPFSETSKALCDRHFGVGGDGVVAVRPLGGNAFEMRIYNSDGTETEMCGNATRCVALYIKTRNLAAGSEYELHTRGGIVRPKVLDTGLVTVDMGEPRLKRREIPVAGDPDATALDLTVAAGELQFQGIGVSMGNPHLVIFVPDVAKVQLETWGPLLEHSPHYPKKTNVEFVQVLDRRTVRMRVWERGCGVTWACGTGSCATVVAGVLSGRTDRKVRVLLDGGELEIEYSARDQHVYMTGPASEVFAGELNERS